MSFEEIVTETTSAEKLKQSIMDKFQKLKNTLNIKHDSNYTYEQTTFSGNTNFGRTFKPTTISKFGNLNCFFERPDGTKQYVYYKLEYYEDDYKDDDKIG